MRTLPALVSTLLLLPGAAFATMSFTQLDDDVFSITHRVKIIGSRGKATKMVYTKAASLCQAAGFSYMRILDEKSEASQQDDTANASLRVRFYFDESEDRVGCDALADPSYVQEAKAKLQKKGYEPPEPPTADVAAAKEAGTSELGSCTLEQVTAMARAGLPDEKIRAACEEDG